MLLLSVIQSILPTVVVIFVKLTIALCIHLYSFTLSFIISYHCHMCLYFVLQLGTLTDKKLLIISDPLFYSLILFSASVSARPRLGSDILTLWGSRLSSFFLILSCHEFTGIIFICTQADEPFCLFNVKFPRIEWRNRSFLVLALLYSSLTFLHYPQTA